MNERNQTKVRAPKIVPKDAPPKFNGWDDVPAERRNIAQRIAARTRGIVTPANAVTVASNVLAADGIIDMCQGNYGVGAAKFIGARSGDWVDGKLARSTGTQSWLGEALDVCGDKVQTLIGLGALTIYGDYPLEASIPKLASQAAIVGVSVWATKRGADLHPGMSGKIALGSTGASMAAFEAANGLAANHADWALGTTIGAYALTGVSIVAGAKAAWNYYRAGKEAQVTAAQPEPLSEIAPLCADSPLTLNENGL